jgi:hypothetical protein
MFFDHGPILNWKPVLLRSDYCMGDIYNNIVGTFNSVVHRQVPEVQYDPATV